MSIRLRLTLLNTLIFALALGIFGSMVRVQVEHNLMQAIDKRLKRGHRFVPEDGKYSLAGLERWRERMRQSKSRTRDPEFPFPFYDRHGLDLLDKSHTAPDISAFTEVQTVRNPVFSTTATRRCYTVPLLAEETGEPLFFQISESLQPVEEELSRLNRTLLTMIPIALLLAGVGGMFLTGRAMAPVRALTDATGRIGVNDLSERLPVHGKDEFARLEETFNGMLARLETAFEQQRRFVADASHELKTPLTVIKANSSLSLSDPDLSPDYRETFLEIDRAADRTSRIVQDLLVLARSDHGQLNLKETELPLAPLFDGAINEARRLQTEGATIVSEVGREAVWGDPHLLHRVLLNLLDNALRHTPRTGTIQVVARPDGFQVKDDGEGIAPEHLAHLGERFYRVDSARARIGGGTGLGLSISRAIVQAHGGTLTIDSELGRGTTVTVTLHPHG